MAVTLSDELVRATGLSEAALQVEIGGVVLRGPRQGVTSGLDRE